jgi:hypothetical protein
MAEFGDFCIYIGGRGGFPSPLQNKFVTKSPIIPLYLGGGVFLLLI